MAAASADVLVVGGGIAGLAAAAQLAANARVTLLEREPMIAAHASGRNAAIYRPLELDATTAQLGRRSLALFEGWMQRPVLERSGLALVAAKADDLEPLRRHAECALVTAEELGREALWRRLPVLSRGECAHGLWVPDGGVLDIGAMTTALHRVARDRGARSRLGVGLASVERRGDRVVGARLGDGSHLACSAVVLAAGAWSLTLGRQLGAPLPLRPLRRHLVQLASGEGPDDRPAAVVWRIDDEVYFRAEGEGYLSSPCDEAPSEPCDPPSDPRALEALVRKLERMAPSLSQAGVRRSWACLRTFAPDRELVIGPDPRVEGLYWMTGFGGRGMGVGAAAGELLAATFERHPHPLAATVAPARLL